MRRLTLPRLADVVQFLRSPSPRRRFALTLTALVTAGLGGGTLYARAVARFLPPLPPGDTVVVYGPQTFTAPLGILTIHVEHFDVTLAPGRQYVLKVENGDADGSHRIDGNTIRLNGTTVLSSDDLSQNVAGWTRPVQPLTSNVLVVSIKGGVGAHVKVSLLTVADPTVSLFQEHFTRGIGGPVTFTRTFSAPATTGAPQYLCLVNGNADGTNRVLAGSIKLNGVQLLGLDSFGPLVGSAMVPVQLQATNTLEIELGGLVAGAADICVRATDSSPPVLTITAPAADLVTHDAQVLVSGTVTDATEVTVTVNGTATTIGSGGAWSATVPLPTEGLNTISISAVDAAGHHTDSTRVVRRDTQAPLLTVTTPADNAITGSTTVIVSGTVTDASTVTLNVNGLPITVGAQGSFSQSVPITEGSNVLVITATDAANNVTSAVRNVRRDTQAPVLTVTAPLDNASVTTATVTVTGTVTDATALTLTVNGDATPIVSGAFTHDVALVLGPNTITVRATDAANNVTTVTRTVTRANAGPQLPPDPSTVAPRLDPTVANNLFAANSFLFTGPGPIQTGVATGTISPTRMSVVRGRAVDRSMQAATGATVRILNHPEFGSTLSRADGRFDLAVNGGGSFIVEASKPGFLAVQRRVPAPWQTWISLDSVVMVPLDTAVTAINFSAPIQVARGSVVTDADGTRQATLLFSQGTTTSFVLADGTVQPVSGAIHVRATEYTVGPSGPQAMPGNLPTTSAYTYAAELSVDEAIAAGATQVQFSQPVSFYVENFLNMPLGAVVPVGFYDRVAGAWKPEADGRVVKIVSVTGGLADVAVTAVGAPASQAVLDSLGFSNAERTELATRYAVGTTLWRSRHTHFSPIDWNFEYFLPPFGFFPQLDLARLMYNTLHDRFGCQQSGSIIDVQNQCLGEGIGIAGTPFSLSYRSDRAPGFRAYRRITIPAQIRVDTALYRAGRPIGRNEAPSDMVEAYYELVVAGRTISAGPFSGASPLPETTLEWDGNDAAGRRVIGDAKAVLSIEFRHRNLYVYMAAGGGETGSSFGTSGNSPTPVRSGRTTVPLVKVWEGSLGSWDARSQGFGGWSLSDHHAYDPTSGIVYMGDGRRIEAQALGQTVRTHQGVPLPADLTVGPDGNLYILFGGNGSVVQKHSPDGLGPESSFAGVDGSPGYNGEGLPATQSKLNFPSAVAWGPDGLLYIADENNQRIRRVDADGKMRTIAGTGSNVSSGDGGLATQAGLAGPKDLAFLPDGSVLFTERPFPNRIRRIDPSGIVTRFAGTGVGGTAGDGGQALAATLTIASGPALKSGADGSVYVLGPDPGQPWFIVRRIAPDGIITTVAGRRNAFAGGTPATQAFLPDVVTLAVTSDNELRLALESHAQVVGVTPTGDIRIVAGTIPRCVFLPQSTSCTPALPMNTGLATQFVFGDVRRLAVTPDHRLIVGDGVDNKVRSINPAFPGFNENDILVASDDGRLAYQFNQFGRHLRTLDAATRDTLLEFSYGATGYLTGITDADGQVTTIERTDSIATAIVGPFGQRTTLTYDGNGFLSTVLNPKGERVSLTTSADGMLQALHDPRNEVHAFTYDPFGRLLTDTDPAGRTQTLARVTTDTSTVVTRSDDLGRTSTYRTDFLPNNARRSTMTDQAGLNTVWTLFANDSSVVQSPDGSQLLSVHVGDARFGAQSPITSHTEVTLPSGLKAVITGGRNIALSDVNDPLSLATLADSLVVNGRIFRSLYTRATHTLVTTSAVGRTATTLYDATGRVTQVQVPGRLPAFFQYDARGRLSQTQVGGRVATFAYDAAGRLLSTTDPLGQRDSLFYDTADRVTRRVLADGRTVLFAYDSSGNLTSVTPPGRPAHAFAYAPADRLSIYAPPTAGLPTSATNFTYNTAGQVRSVQRPDGITAGLTYDAAGRVSTATFDRGQLGYTYSPTTGNLATLTGPGGNNVALTYDGGLPTSITWSGTVTGSVGVSYDANFRIAGESVNGANTVSFGYDLDGLLVQAGALGLKRDGPTGRLVSDSLIAGSGTVRNAYAYDAHGAFSRMDITRNTDSLFATSYERDSLNRITHLVERIAGISHDSRFVYDSVGRLKSVQRDGVPAASYTYDLNGNRLSRTTSGGTVTGTYDDQDRLLTYGSANYTYTANGELRFRVVGTDTTKYTYDALGNLTRVVLPDGTDIGYVIDPQNRRIAKSVNGAVTQRWLYDGQLTPVAELDGTGALISRFVYATGANIPDYVLRGGATYRIIRDHVGSARLIVDATAGTVIQRIDYDEFGGETQNTNPGFQPFGYAGGLTDATTGLVRFGARDYDPTIGRWTAKDPIGFAGGTLSVYAYVGNDPINNADPSGLLCVPGLNDLANYSAGFGDESSFGATNTIREQYGFNDSIDRSSPAYRSGQWTARGVSATMAALGVVAAVRAVGGWLAARSAAQAAEGAAQQGIRLYRVFGGEARGLGRFYTTVDPTTVADFRTAAGLYDNAGSHVLEGTLNDLEGVIFRSAGPGPGGVGGGLPEVFVPHPATQINVTRVFGINPPF